MEMERPWLILGRALRRVAKAGHGAAAAVGAGAEAEAQQAVVGPRTQLEQRVTEVDMDEEEAAAVHAGAEAAQQAVVGPQAQVEQRVTEVDMDEDPEEAAAAEGEAAQAGYAAAEPDFTISVKPPPLVTFLTTGISYPSPPAKPCGKPHILASGPFCLLAQFAAEPPRDANKFYYFSPTESHLVLLRHFHYGVDGRIAACAELVPDRGDDIPKLLLSNVDSVGLLCDDADRSFLIAELKIIMYTSTDATDSRDEALLICYRSSLGTWSRNLMDVPFPRMVDDDCNVDGDCKVDGDCNVDGDFKVDVYGVVVDGDDGKKKKWDGYRRWIPHGVVSVDSTIFWFDLSWGLLSLDFNLQKSEFRLEFCSLPPDHDLNPDESKSMADIYSNRCITVSENLLRYVEIMDPKAKAEAPKVCMWCCNRLAGVNGWEWEWTLNFEVGFEDIWTSDTYIRSGLPRLRPRLACVNPADSNVIYFTIEQSMFGVHVPQRRVIHLESIEIVSAARPNSRHFLSWNLPGLIFGHVSPDQEEDVCDSKGKEPQDPKGKSLMTYG